jgi:hypothetical protein
MNQERLGLIIRLKSKDGIIQDLTFKDFVLFLIKIEMQAALCFQSREVFMSVYLKSQNAVLAVFQVTIAFQSEETG